MITELVGDVLRSGERMARAVAEMEQGPSGLDGCSRGWVASHVVRSVEAYLWLLALARTGEEPGPRLDGAAIARAVAAGADRSGAELAAELRGRLAELAEASAAMPEDGWQCLVPALAGWRHPAWYTLYRCWRELETHHVDLAVGHGPEDWPQAYVRWALEDTLAALAAREFAIGYVEATDLGRSWQVGEGPGLVAPGSVILAWLSGRSGRSGTEGMFIPPVWPLPPAPGWD